MKKLNLGGLIYFLIILFCASLTLKSVSVGTQTTFVTLTANEKNDGEAGTFGWKPVLYPTRSFRLTFKAIKAYDLFISLRSSKGLLDIVIGGWGNRNAGISFQENGKSVSAQWLCSETTPVDGAITMPGCTAVVPDTTNPVEYTLTVAQGKTQGEGFCQILGKKQDGTVVKILETSHVWFNDVFKSYSFKAWNGPVQIADDVVVFLDKGCWFKVLGVNKFLGVGKNSELSQLDEKPIYPTFYIQQDPSDPSKKFLRSYDVQKYFFVKNLPLLDSNNLLLASKDSAKILAEESVVDSSYFGRAFSLETVDSGFKIKVVGGPYLRLDDDGFVRAFKPDPAKNNKYVVPITQAEATVFAVEDAQPSPSLNEGDVIAFKFVDGSYIGFDDVGSPRMLRQNILGIMDPRTHFKVHAYSDHWRASRLMALCSYGYDVATDAPLATTGHGTVISYDQTGQPNKLQLGNKKDTAVIPFEYNPNPQSSNNFSFGYRGNKISKNTSGVPNDVLILKGVNASTPPGDYLFSIVSVKPSQRIFEGLVSPTSIDALKADLETKFKVAFSSSAKTEEEWQSLFLFFNQYIRRASELEGFAAPQGTPLISARDSALAIIKSAFNLAPQSVKTNLTDLQTFLADIPVYLLDTATPPTLLSEVQKYTRLIFKMADDIYLGADSNGKIVALKTSLFDPATHFMVSDYNQANGRITLYLNNQKDWYQAGSYLRGYQAADGTLSFGLTQTARGIDLVVNNNDTKSVSFSYGGKVIAPSAASLGLNSTSVIQNFTAKILKTETVHDRMILMPPDRQMIKRQVDIDIRYWGYNFATGNASFSSLDWAFYTKAFCEYLKKAPSLAPDWNDPVSQDSQNVSARYMPEIVINGSCGSSIAEFAQRVFTMMSKSPNLTAEARKNLMNGALLFAPFKAGQKVFLNSGTGAFLVKQAINGKNVLKVQGASTYDANALFEIAEYSPTTGIFVLKDSSGLYLAKDAATNELILQKARAELALVYDTASNKIMFGQGGKFAQVDGLSGNVKISADQNTALSFTVKESGDAGAQALGILETDAVDVVVDQKFKPLFTAIAGKTTDDWLFLINTLSGYIQKKVVTPEDYVVWGTLQSSLGNKSSRDIVIAFLTGLSAELQKQIQSAQASAKTSFETIINQCSQIISKMQDIPVYVDSAVPSRPVSGIVAQSTIALRSGIDSYLVRGDSSDLTITSTIMLDPATHIVVDAYDQAKSRAIFKAGEKYVDISRAAPYSFELKDTPRYVEIKVDEANARVFSFVVAGKIASELQVFEVVGPLSDVQKSFKSVFEHMNTAPSAQNVLVDIQTCFDPLFAELGAIPGDWLYYVQKFDAYLRFVSKTIRFDSVQLTGVRGGTLLLKEYVNRIFTSISGAYSSAPAEVKELAKQTLLWSSGSSMSSGGPSAENPLNVGDAVFVQVVGSDGTTKKNLTWSNGKLSIAVQRPLIDKSMHFKVLLYDANAKTLQFGIDSLVFEQATKSFVAKEPKDVAALVLEQVMVGSQAYYYLKNAVGEKLAITDDAPVFNTSGSLFNFEKIQSGFMLLDDIGIPSTAADFERDLTKFVTAFDASAIDSGALSYVLGLFDSYCSKASEIVAWSTEKSSAGSTFKEYAKLLLTVITKSSSYSGLTPALSSKIASMLANNSAFLMDAKPAVDLLEDLGAKDTGPQDAGEQRKSYDVLDGTTGDLLAELPIFNSALEAAFNSKNDLNSILIALNLYVEKAIKRADWYALGVATGKAVPRDYALAMLQRVLDNDWFFTGLDADLIAKIRQCMTTAKNNAASYPAQLSLLDSYAKEITAVSALTSSSRLIVLLKSILAEFMVTGTPDLRMQLLKKIELYFDRSIVPALQLAKIDAQKNSWAMLLFGLELQLISGEATTLALLDEKIVAFEQIVVPRIRIMDVAILYDAISNFLTLVKNIVPALQKLVPDSTDNRFKRFTAIVFTYIDFVVRQGQRDTTMSDEQRAVLTGIQDLVHEIKVVLGLVSQLEAKPAVVVQASQPVAEPVVLRQSVRSVYADEFNTPISPGFSKGSSSSVNLFQQSSPVVNVPQSASPQGTIRRYEI